MISIMSKNLIKKYKNVLGKKPYKMTVSQPESFDIDTIYDFKLSELYYKDGTMMGKSHAEAWKDFKNKKNNPY